MHPAVRQEFGKGILWARWEEGNGKGRGGALGRQNSPFKGARGKVCCGVFGEGAGFVGNGEVPWGQDARASKDVVPMSAAGTKSRVFCVSGGEVGHRAVAEEGVGVPMHAGAASML